MSSQRETKIYEHGNARTRLKELGLDADQLRNVALEGHSYRQEATDNHPPTHGGTVAYGTMVRALRDHLIPQGWLKSNEHNFCVTRNPKTNIAIVVAAGDGDTGLAGDPVNTRRSKGLMAHEAVASNVVQMTLFDGDWLKNVVGEKPQRDVVFLPTTRAWKTYYFLHFYDRAGDELRSELSMPVSVDAQGRLSGWAERIIMSPIDLSDNPVLRADVPPSAPDPEMMIKRRG